MLTGDSLVQSRSTYRCMHIVRLKHLQYSPQSSWFSSVHSTNQKSLNLCNDMLAKRPCLQVSSCSNVRAHVCASTYLPVSCEYIIHVHSYVYEQSRA